ncbi:MarR family winged helix-turn-helix transcriptional regulator [Actinoplanes philippinensis]|uniref:MarR family winged helix-turn-helix transcriptional regulator n=1 Tax=Actinoplanes philippinensis TaxID=35752 RepID=UPI0034007C5F
MSLATRHDSADESPGLLLWQVTNRWQAAQRAALKPFDLTHVQFVLLATLTYLQASGAVTQKALADMAVTDPMMVSQVLRTLESRDLVHRPPHPTDRRARAVAATDRGRALANQAVVAVEACDAAFFAALGDGLPAFTGSLRLLRTTAPGPAPEGPVASAAADGLVADPAAGGAAAALRRCTRRRAERRRRRTERRQAEQR